MVDAGFATSALDSHAEKTVQMHAGKIVVINKGEIEAVGRFNDLIKRSPTFESLYSTQFSLEAEDGAKLVRTLGTGT